MKYSENIFYKYTLKIKNPRFVKTLHSWKLHPFYPYISLLYRPIFVRIMGNQLLEYNQGKLI